MAWCYNAVANGRNQGATGPCNRGRWTGMLVGALDIGGTKTIAGLVKREDGNEKLFI